MISCLLVGILRRIALEVLNWFSHPLEKALCVAPLALDEARRQNHKICNFKWSDKLFAYMRFNFVLWSMITTNVSTFFFLVSRLKLSRARCAKEAKWKQHAITQEYIEFFPSHSLCPFPPLFRLPSLYRKIETKKSSWKKSGSMAFWRVSYADEMERLRIKGNNCKVFRISHSRAEAKMIVYSNSSHCSWLPSRSAKNQVISRNRRWKVTKIESSE